MADALETLCGSAAIDWHAEEFEPGIRLTTNTRTPTDTKTRFATKAKRCNGLTPQDYDRSSQKSVPRHHTKHKTDPGTHLHQGATCSVVDVPSKHQLARVAVSAETWLEFRRAALGQGISIAAYLGRLVDAEVRRRSGRPVRELQADASTSDQAFAALAEVRASIDELDAIAGRLARAAIAHGGTWEDVASSLRLSRARAMSAYDRDG